ncbi:hypothetical protein J6590_037333 [Homalodisca vitripennis]|nr:hypothetical protein J6590_037333 [Homalodisca vitripennis]
MVARLVAAFSGIMEANGQSDFQVSHTAPCLLISHAVTMLVRHVTPYCRTSSREEAPSLHR